MHLTSRLCSLLILIASLTTRVSAQTLQKNQNGNDEANDDRKKGPIKKRKATPPDVLSKEDEPKDSAATTQSFEEGMENWFETTKGARNYDLTEHMVDAVWGLHRRWKNIATKRRNSINFYKQFAVLLISTGAVLQTLSHQLAAPYEWITSLVAGGCLGVAPFVTQHFLSHEKMTAWIVSRATAEALKAEVIKFQAGVRPFHGDDSVEALAMRASKILEPASEYDFETSMNINNILWSIDESQASRIQRKASIKSRGQYKAFNGNCRSFNSKTSLHPPPNLKHKKESYIDWRLKPQVECVYRNGSRRLRKHVLLIKTTQNILAAGSSGIAFIAARSRFMSAAGKEGPLTFINARIGNVGIWGAVMTTIAAAIGTQFASSKLDEISAEYRDAANSIERNVLIMSSKKMETGTEEWYTFVQECERIIAETNRALKTVFKASGEDFNINNDLDATRKWNPNAECKDDYSGSHSAADRAKWLIDNKGYSSETAQKRVMKEYPEMF